MKTIQSGGEQLGKEKTRKENRVPGNKHSRSLTYLFTLYTTSVRKIFFFFKSGSERFNNLFQGRKQKIGRPMSQTDFKANYDGLNRDKGSTEIPSKITSCLSMKNCESVGEFQEDA